MVPREDEIPTRMLNAGRAIKQPGGSAPQPFKKKDQ
jgi:hypothetical protein